MIVMTFHTCDGDIDSLLLDILGWTLSQVLIISHHGINRYLTVNPATWKRLAIVPYLVFILSNMQLLISGWFGYQQSFCYFPFFTKISFIYSWNVNASVFKFGFHKQFAYQAMISTLYCIPCWVFVHVLYLILRLAYHIFIFTFHVIKEILVEKEIWNYIYYYKVDY